MIGSLARVKSQVWCGLYGVACIAVIGFWGCAKTSKTNGPGELSTQVGGSVSSVEAGSADTFVLRVNPRASLDADPPMGIDANAVLPLTGDALIQAKTPLEELGKALRLPEGLREGSEGAMKLAPQEASAPSLETQRLFAAALQQGLEGQGSQAVRLLEAAIRQSPGEPTLLRRLARGWASLGNRVRATAYFRQSVAANANDLESVVALGRLLIESGNAEEGTAALLHALQQGEALATLDPALPPLTRFYASAGLRLLGYTQASAELLDGFLDTDPPEGLRPTRYGAELMFLYRRASVHEVARGDLQARLGDFRAARLAYECARRSGASGDDLSRRVVYADLRLGRLDEATQVVLDAVQTQSAAPAALGLVEYLVSQGVPAEPIIRGLRALSGDDENAEATTLALASALPRASAIALLGEALDESPASARLYEKQLSFLLDETATEADREQALRRAAAAIENDPANAARNAGALLALAGDLSPLRDAFAEIAPEQRDTPAAQTLEAVVLLELGDIEAARSKLDAALASDTSPPLARIEMARLLALEQDFSGAQALLDSIGSDAQDARLGQLRVAVLLNLDREDEALALLNELIEGQPNDARFTVQKSRLLARQERFVEAERALLDALTANPRVEALYAELLQLYDTHGSELDDHPQGYQRLVRRMLETIPESRISRLTYAGILEVRGNNDQAERLLDTLLAQNPNDRDALLIQLDVYAKTARVPEADAIVERLLDAEPQNPEVLRAAVSHYRRTKNDQGLADVEERWLRSQEPGVGRDFSLARLLGGQGRTDEALELLDKVKEEIDPAQANALHFVTVQVLQGRPLRQSEVRLKRIIFDDTLDAQLRKIAAYALGTAYEAADRPDDTDATFLALLEAMPEDPDLNNHVGYVWAHAGRRLEEAEQRIAKALEARKDESAFLDSMGWVRYKQGDLVGAEQWLRRATRAVGGDNPVIVDHLGDTLYRLGRVDEAETMWKRAQAGMNDPQNQDTGDPETDTVLVRTSAKLEALEAGEGEPVPVASLGPGVVAPKPADGQEPAVQQAPEATPIEAP